MGALNTLDHAFHQLICPVTRIIHRFNYDGGGTRRGSAMQLGYTHDCVPDSGQQDVLVGYHYEVILLSVYAQSQFIHLRERVMVSNSNN